MPTGGNAQPASKSCLPEGMRRVPPIRLARFMQSSLRMSFSQNRRTFLRDML